MRAFVTICALVEGLYMLFDGVHALLTGSYIVAAAGPYAGRLGPWAAALRYAGIDPASGPAHALFVVLGGALVVSAILYRLQVPAGRYALLAAAVLTLWYAPFGTLLSAVLVIVVAWKR
jgi:hypothetical protein